LPSGNLFPESGVINVSLALKNGQVVHHLLMSKHRAFRLSIGLREALA
jgi:hypothetical protein